MVDVPRGEKIVRHIRANVLVAHTPHSSRRHGRDLADKLFVEVPRRVGVALDVVLPAIPLPGRGPGDGGARSGVESRAL